LPQSVSTAVVPSSPYISIGTKTHVLFTERHYIRCTWGPRDLGTEDLGTCVFSPWIPGHQVQCM